MPNWQISVTLEDISIADAGSAVLGEFTQEKLTELPVQFAISYSPAAIDSRRLYSVSAGVYDKTNPMLIYSSSKSYPVLTNGYSNETHIIVDAVN